MWIRNSFVAVTVALLGCSSESECLEKKTCTRGSIDAAKPEAGEGGAPIQPVATGGRGDVGSGGAPPSSKGGSGPGPTATSVGAACDGEGERICNTTGSGSILECVDGEWKRLESCVRGSRCDTSQVRCAPIVPGCERLAAGSSFCRAQTRVTCGPDLVTSEEEECAGRCAGGNCVAASCGDGVPQEEEVCDDGNTDDDDACTSACELPACGDGIVSAGEECDDGNDDNSDGCTSDCVAAEHAQNLKDRPPGKFAVLARLSRAPERSVGGYVSTGAQRKRSQNPKSPGVVEAKDTGDGPPSAEMESSKGKRSATTGTMMRQIRASTPAKLWSAAMG